VPIQKLVGVVGLLANIMLIIVYSSAAFGLNDCAATILSDMEFKSHKQDVTLKLYDTFCLLQLRTHNTLGAFLLFDI